MKIDIKQLEFIDTKLRSILIGVEAAYGTEFTITSLYRINDPGVHGTLPLRGTDLRCKNDAMGEMIEQDLNKIYAYDPERPNLKVCMYHDTGLGKHLHIQVHPNTEAR